MESIETLIPDNEGNHLVVALSFYDDIIKAYTFQIPEEFYNIDIADIAINKLDLKKPLNIRAFFRMCDWLLEQFLIFPNAVFSFICSTDHLATNHPEISAQQYRWQLFEYLYYRSIPKLLTLGIESKDIIVGTDDNQTFARVFYRIKHAPIIHIVTAFINSKYDV